MKNLRFAICDLRFEMRKKIRRSGSALFESQIANRKSQIPLAFTLIELLVVIGLIVLILALAVPAFNYITGSRSVDAGQNLASAMLARARAEAIANEEYTGVAFFYDPESERTTMSIVTRKSTVGVDPDFVDGPYDNYKAWQVNFAYKVGHEVVSLVTDTAESKDLVRKYVCKQNHTSSLANAPPNDPPWEAVDATSKFIDFSAEGEFQKLPPGIDAQLVNDWKGDTTTTDRYVRTGIIMFNAEGRLESIPYQIQQASALGQRIGLTTDLTQDNGSPAKDLTSQLGLLLYERDAFRNAPNTSEADYYIDIPSLGAAPAASAELGGTGTPPPEEGWLDTNGLLLLVNRYNGTLMRGE